MNSLWIFIIVLLYFGVLLLISRFTSRNSDSQTFFTGNNKSPWLVVAYGMIGAALSGVTFVSIPGWVESSGFYFGQFILGNVVGYIIITFVLIPLYYRLKLVSIYEYLDQRFGFFTYKTGSLLFILSQSFGAALRMLLAVIVLHEMFGSFFLQFFPHDSLAPQWIMAFVFLVLIFLYTYKSGIKTIVWTDLLQTTFLLLAAILTVWVIYNQLDVSFSVLWEQGTEMGLTKFFNAESNSRWFFPKQFVAGILISIAMMGLDQNMMQKSLTISNVKNAQKNTFLFSFTVAIAQFFFLFLGMMLFVYTSNVQLNETEYKDYLNQVEITNSIKEKNAAEQIKVNQNNPEKLIDIKEQVSKSLTTPKQMGDASLMDALPYNPQNGNLQSDKVFPFLAVTKGKFGLFISIMFILGIIAAAFSSSDSALTALTTSFCYDFLGLNKKEFNARTRVQTHIAFSFFLFFIIVAFSFAGRNIIDLIFSTAAYTYSPLLALFFLGILTKIKLWDIATPFACVLGPFSTWLFVDWLKECHGFDMGFLVILVSAVWVILYLLLFKLIQMVFAIK